MGGNYHALLWYNTSASAVDLNPSGFNSSLAYDINTLPSTGTQEVGYEYHGYGRKLSRNALERHGIHRGRSQQFLPSGFTDSYANAIDAYGNIAGQAIDASGNGHAILWKAVHLPGDANMDNTVNGPNLNIVLSNYNQTGMTWAQGDFNYDAQSTGRT